MQSSAQLLILFQRLIINSKHKEMFVNSKENHLPVKYNYFPTSPLHASNFIFLGEMLLLLLRKS